MKITVFVYKEAFDDEEFISRFIYSRGVEYYLSETTGLNRERGGIDLAFYKSDFKDEEGIFVEVNIEREGITRDKLKSAVREQYPEVYL